MADGGWKMDDGRWKMWAWRGVFQILRSQFATSKQQDLDMPNWHFKFAVSSDVVWA